MYKPAIFYIQFKQKYLFNIGTLCLQDSLHRNMFTQHMLSNSSTSWMFQKYWVHTTQYVFVLCAANLRSGHVPDSRKVMQARGSTRHFLQPIVWTTMSTLAISGSTPLWHTTNCPVPFDHPLSDQNTSNNSQQWPQKDPRPHSWILTHQLPCWWPSPQLLPKCQLNSKWKSTSTGNRCFCARLLLAPIPMGPFSWDCNTFPSKYLPNIGHLANEHPYWKLGTGTPLYSQRTCP